MKRLLLSIAALSIAGAAAAQTAPPDPVTLTVSRATLGVIGQGIMELPYKVAAPVMNDLQAQISAQDNKVAQQKPESPRPAPEQRRQEISPPADAAKMPPPGPE